MRAVLWFLILFAVAVALAMFAGANASSVTLFYAPYRVDLSLNLVLVLLLAAFVLLHLALRALAALFELPRQARRWRLQQKERAMHIALMEAYTHLLAGRFLRARKCAELALHQEASLRQQVKDVPQGAQLRAMAHILAADSAHALQDRTARQQHLQQLLDDGGLDRKTEVSEAARLRAANWALDDQAPAEALNWLEQLPQGMSRRLGTQRVRLKAARLAGRPALALDTARVLLRHGAFAPDVGASLIKSLASDCLRQSHDLSQLDAAWQALDSAERQLPEIVCAAAEQALQLTGAAHKDGARARALQWLLAAWPAYGEMASATQERYVRLLQASLTDSDAAWLARIESAQQARPQDANLQYLAGMACVRHQLWGKAQQLLSKASAGLRSERLRRHAWIELSELARARGDHDAAQHAIQQAAQL
jgi:HemY protein